MVLRRILQSVSWLALAATLLPSCLFLASRMELDSVKTTMLAATIVWFAVTPFWMQHKSDDTHRLTAPKGDGMNRICGR